MTPIATALRNASVLRWWADTKPGFRVPARALYAQKLEVKEEQDVFRLFLQRIVALRADPEFAKACAALPKLAALVEQANCVLEGKPFDEGRWVGGGS